MRHSVESVLRNRRRSLFAVIGIVLALSLISGALIAVDSSAMGQLRAAIGKVPVDFVSQEYRTNSSIPVYNDSYFAPRIAALESVQGVRKVSPIVSVSGIVLTNLSGFVFEQYYTSSAVFLPENSSSILSEFKIEGVLPDPGTVAISRAVADRIQIDVGDGIVCSFQKYESHYDPINFTYSYNYSYLNITFSVSQIWTQGDVTSSTPYYPMYDSGRSVSDPERSVSFVDISNPVVFNMVDTDLLIPSSTAFLGYPAVSSTYYVWIDRAEVISLADVPGTLSDLDFIKNRLDIKGQRYSLQVTRSPLVEPLSELYPQLQASKVLFLALSLPVVALGTYLSVVGVDLGVTSRKREVGILKSRGASNKQVFSSLIMESLLLGTFAGVSGVVLGLLVSRFLLDVATSFSTSTVGDSLISDIRVTSGTVAVSVLFGIFLMFASSYRPFKRVSKTEISEALHYYSPSIAQIDYKPRMDIILLGLSVWSVASVLIGASGFSDLNVPWYVAIILGIALVIGILVFPLMPFLLSLSVVRLLTRGSRKLYAKFTLLVKPWTKDLHYLVDKNIVRNPRRASNLAVIISLALAFGLFVSVTMESNIAYQNDIVKFDVGSDIKVTGYNYGDRTDKELNASHLGEVSSIPGVEHSVLYQQIGLTVDMIGYGNYLGAVVFDPSDFADTVRPGNSYFVDTGADVLADLETDGTVLVSEYIMRSSSLVVGDTLRAQFQSWDSYGITGTWYLNLLVIGEVRLLPGIQSGELFIGDQTMAVIPDANLTLGTNMFGSIITVAEGSDPHDVASDVEDLYARNGLDTSTMILEDRLEELRNDPTYGALADFLYVEYVLSLLIMSVGVGLIIFVAVSDREQELACIMARGSSSSQMRKILMGESMSLMFLGLTVGAIVGILTAYLFNTLFGDVMYGVVERRMVLSAVTLVMVAASVLSLIVASLLATARAGKVRVAEALRIRGG